MKFIFKLLLAIQVILISTTSCNKMLEPDSDRFIKADDYKLNSSKDGIYAMSGIFSQLQKIAERYVVLGELRGDLMDVTSDANTYLKQIYNFEVTADNPYANIKDYYAIINNCNFLIAKIDTSIIAGGQKVMYTGYAATKAIRAWTYMQIALNYGKAVYYEKPILSLEDAEKVYPQYTITELASVLIPDLLPWKDIPYPQFGVIGELNTSNFYFPIRFLLGDLYLWSGQYESAANEYHDLIYKEGLGSFSFKGTWEVVNGAFISQSFTMYSYENLSELGTTTEHGEGSHLLELSFPLSANGSSNIVMIKSSAVAVKNWNDQVYYDSNPLFHTPGDLRGEGWAYISGSYTISWNGKISRFNAENLIGKYFKNNSSYSHSEIIPIYKTGLLYLRYAEAVNRLGKPNLAFAVLKYGLNKANLANRTIIPGSEVPSPKPNYMNFDTTWFTNNIGIHARGCGYMQNDTSYVLPALASKDDSIVYIENMIKMELALETAFDGNRFHDLMRIALRRNDPSYLADAVAEKYAGNKEAIRSKLKNKDNWYLPVK